MCHASDLPSCSVFSGLTCCVLGRSICAELGMDLSPSELQDEFGRLDRNGGGMVMFEEFCTWMGEVQAAALGWGELVSLFNRQAAQAEARKSDADMDASLSRAERRSLR